jgi:hypothetical protein
VPLLLVAHYTPQTTSGPATMNEVQSNEMTTETKVQLQVETKDFITHLVENSFSVDDIYDFIAEYGEDKFINYYEQYVNDCYCVDIPAFLVIDWEESFDSLDFVFTENGYVFDTCF